MRDPSRIFIILNKIGNIWIKNPDLRFGQLIEILTNDCKIPLFYLEERDFEKLIDKFNKEI